MSIEYKVIPTKLGKEKLAEISGTGNSLTLQSFKISKDKPKELDENRTNLDNLVYVSGINEIVTNENNINITCVIPAKYGGFYLGEIGLYDEENNLIFYGNIPYQYKPTAEEGGADIHIPISLKVNTANVKLELDPSKSLAMKSDLDEIRELIEDIDIPNVFHNATMNAVTEDMIPSDFEYGVTICNQGQVNAFPTIRDYGVSITIRGVHASYAQIFITRFGDMWSRRSGVINEWNGEWYNSKREIDKKADKDKFTTSISDLWVALNDKAFTDHTHLPNDIYINNQGDKLSGISAEHIDYDGWDNVRDVLDKKADKDNVVLEVNGEKGSVELDASNINYSPGWSVYNELSRKASTYDVARVKLEVSGLGDEIGNLDNLDTTNKDNLVEAINEVNSKSGVSGTGVRSSTIVIANYDSHENSKKGADILIEEGENASVKINEAIQSLEGTGGEVKLMEGRYNLEYGIAVNVDGVHLTGIPRATILVQNKKWKGNPFNNDRKHVIDTWRDSVLENVNVEISNIYVKGANISGTNGFNCYDSSKVTNCISENSGSYGFCCYGSSKITNCISEGSGKHGFQVSDSSKVTNCTSENSVERGFNCYDSSKVTNCISENSGSYGFCCYGSSKITNCISENSVERGFDCYDSSTITNCTSENSGEFGLRLGTTFKGICGYNALVGDTFADNSISPAIVQYNIIQEGV